MSKKSTIIHNIYIEKFRGLHEINIPLGKRITLLCGKNGTSKSTILGILAQMFNFDKDRSKDKNDQNYDLTNYKTLINSKFISKLGDHFRLSPIYDMEMNVQCNLYDGIEGKEKNIKLTFTNSKDRSHNYQRPVIRDNIDVNGNNNSRKIVHPVIYLSTKRLFPIPLRQDYDLINKKYIENEENQKIIRDWTNAILIREYNQIDCTTGDFDSAIVHNDKYDYHSASVGEDNLGQILLSILSFKKLKEEFSNYSGGLLLIDEVDASLFPGAQRKLFSILMKICKKYNIQVVATTHSFDLIEYFSCFSEQDNQNYKLHFLTNAFGDTSIKTDYDLCRIRADLRAETIQNKNESSWPKINLYLEDDEAKKFFKSLVIKRTISSQLNIQSVELGCENLKTLRDKEIIKSEDIIVLDGDFKMPSGDKYSNFCQLPTHLPPDQLLYDILYHLPPEDNFWKNDKGFTHEIFISKKHEYLDFLPTQYSSLSEEIEKIRKSKQYEKGMVRNSFKSFYKDKEIQQLLKNKETNPFRIWTRDNSELANDFQNNILKKLKKILESYGISKTLLDKHFD